MVIFIPALSPNLISNMKKSMTAFVLSAMLFSCSPEPDEVAYEFMENLTQGKVVEAKKYATEPTGKLLDFASKTGDLKAHPDAAFEVLNDSVADHRAWVTFEDLETNNPPPFDVDFNSEDDSEIYCTELIALAINKVLNKEVLVPTLSLNGKMVYALDDIYLHEDVQPITHAYELTKQ